MTMHDAGGTQPPRTDEFDPTQLGDTSKAATAPIDRLFPAGKGIDAPAVSGFGPMEADPAYAPTGAHPGFGPVVLPQDGATLSIGPGGLVMFVQFSDPTPVEVADLRRGRLDIGILTVGSTGILLTRFGAAADTLRYPPKEPIVLECPFHIGLLSADRRRLPTREGALSLALTIVVQDQYGRQHGGRHVGLAILTAEAIERVVSRQAEEAAWPGWTRAVHDAEVNRFCERNPDLGRAADRLFSKAWAFETIQLRRIRRTTARRPPPSRRPTRAASWWGAVSPERPS